MFIKYTILEFMNYSKFVFSNGLRMIAVPVGGAPSVTIAVWVGVGSRHEDRRKAGIAHFFEHIVFKGSRKRPSTKAISEAVDSFGGRFNASTGKEMTMFFIKAPVDRVEDAFDVLSDMVINPLVRKEDVEKEKGVIKAEIDSYEDLPMIRVGEIFENLVFGGNSLERDVIGTKGTVEVISRDDFLEYKDRFYRPNNMLVTVVGGVSTVRGRQLARKSFGEIGGRVNKRIATFSSKQRKPRLKLVYKKTDQTHFVLGFLGERHMHKGCYAEMVLRSILGGGMSSRIFSEVREKRGLAYSVRTYDDYYSDTGSFGTYAGVEPGNACEALGVILNEYRKMTNMGSCRVSKKEFKKAKEYLKGHFALDMENTETVSGYFGYDEIMTGKTRSVKEYVDGIDKVTLDEAVQVAKRLFSPERMSLAVIGPHKSEREFEKIVL